MEEDAEPGVLEPGGGAVPGEGAPGGGEGRGVLVGGVDFGNLVGDVGGVVGLLGWRGERQERDGGESEEFSPRHDSRGRGRLVGR